MVDTHGDFGHPDELYALVVQLFTHFRALDRLMEVFKETKGLAMMAA